MFTSEAKAWGTVVRAKKGETDRIFDGESTGRSGQGRDEGS